MLTKILFTALVIVIVAVVFRVRTRAVKSPPAAAAPQVNSRVTPQLIAYLFVGIILAVSGLVYYLHWRDEHRIVTIRVINSATGEAASYQAYRKRIEGRRFQTLDGRAVTLGDADRVEMLESD